MFLQYSLIFLAAVVMSCLLTPLMGVVARRLNAIDYPGGRRIHRAPTPRFGGAAIFGAIVASLVLSSYAAPGLWDLLSPLEPHSLTLAATATLVTIVGLVDDRQSLSATAKLITEVVVAVCVVIVGYRVELIPIASLDWINSVISVLWITSVMNAVNMIDGLDGLAAGVSLTIALGILCQSFYYHNERHSVILTAVCGAIVGFLPFNFRRARIFLGDSGSLLLGLVLAVAAVQGPGQGLTTKTIVVPLLALGLPLAELFLTVGRRFLREFLVVRRHDRGDEYAFLMLGRPKLFTPDRDHMHHRLLNHGVGSMAAVLTLYLISALLVAVALVGTVEQWQLGYFLLFVGGVFAAARFFGYSDLQLLRKGIFLPLLGRFSSASQPVVVICDVGFSVMSLFLALTFHGTRLSIMSEQLPRRQLVGLTVLVAAQVLGLAVGGLYRESYLAISFREGVAMLRSVILSFIAGIAALMILSTRLHPAVVLLDGYFLGTLVIGFRLSFGILDHIFQHPRTRRVLIYGANPETCKAVDAMRANPELRLVPAGFVDNERRERWFKGLRVYRTGELGALVRRSIADELLIPQVNGNGDPPRVEAITRQCSILGLPVKTQAAYLDGLLHPLIHDQPSGHQ